MLVFSGVCLLLGVIGNVAVKPWKDTSDDPIWKPNEDPMFISLSESPFQNEPDHGMVQLPCAMCDDLRWRGNSKLLHICIVEAIRQLREGEGSAAEHEMNQSVLPLGGRQGGRRHIRMALKNHPLVGFQRIRRLATELLFRDLQEA